MNWKLGLGIIISASFLFLTFHRVNLHELKEALDSANYFYLIPVVALTFLSLWFRTLRWQYMIQPIKDIKLSNLFSALMIGFMVNNLLPARLGEFARAYAIGEKESISKSSSFATIVVERIFDGITILTLLAIILIFWPFSFPIWLRNAAYIACSVYFFTLLFLILLKIQTKKVLSIVEFVCKPFPQKFKIRLMKILSAFVDGLKILHSTKNIIYSAVLSLFVWLPAVLIIYCLLISFGIYLPISVSFFLLVIICIGLMIPSAPGFVGTIQFFCVAGLALFAVPKSQALSFSIIYHASAFIPVTTIGLVYLLKEGLSFTEMRSSIRLKKDHSYENRG